MQMIQLTKFKRTWSCFGTQMFLIRIIYTYFRTQLILASGVTSKIYVYNCLVDL